MWACTLYTPSSNLPGYLQEPELTLILGPGADRGFRGHGEEVGMYDTCAEYQVLRLLSGSVTRKGIIVCASLGYLGTVLSFFFLSQLKFWTNFA